ncbi:cobalamin biosynthesis protein [Candidatus Bathycorpusculum sp.]|uniref:cobalamin biosynthesis protein n=1 Tax=Candidatus Bathycorpusculum sp. TaxID=2994959 RepID=UPI00281A470D|nr:cobalamin biosynthesis protein [Candidatus Termitimicrobium sp.]
MFSFYISLFIDPILIFILAFLIDLVLGEYPDRIHPTIGIGKLITYLKAKAKNKNPRIEKTNGVLMALAAILAFALPVFVLLYLLRGLPHPIGEILYIIVGAILFKATFAISGMGQYTKPIALALKKRDIDGARKWLPYIVRRDPTSLNERQIISAAVESIAESTTDGITAPFFFYALLGVPGAFAYRVINTLDSMVGYKNAEYKNIGWFSAKLDTLTNYIPARITAYLMVVAAFFSGANWRESWRILQRDKHKTSSPNAGYTISAMAGALGIQLEKTDHYKLGDDKGHISYEDIGKALRIMVITSALFGIVVVLPIIALRIYVIGI